MAGLGWNSRTGWDTGGPPPGANQGPGAQSTSHGFYAGGLSRGFSGMGGGGGILGYSPVGFTGAYGFGAGMMPMPYSGIPGPPDAPGPVYTMPANGYQHPVPIFPGQPSRYPNPHPVVNADCPALNLQNSTGGVGCEPGYNYFFPPENTKIHVLKSSTAPWRLPVSATMNFGAYHVPVDITLADVLMGFGATNPSPKKNKITEVIPGGNGKWYKGVTFSGDEKDSMKTTLRALGWDKSRTGRVGEKPAVWVWITKD